MRNLKWITGVVMKVCGPRTYVVKVGTRLKYTHVDHLLKCVATKNTVNDKNRNDMPSVVRCNDFSD